ncbi:hypothetical protein [Calothrix sp. PCC 6303]|uniref:hypothetical protein n=1 Tax=Calothrix sp. PCC 6303 TaxID=1170562 RepID=UPI0002A007A3|nr:hypothetical protein [Calothrix sp. PCC 6303]AFZ01475.1 hypothetical protein Cal6303_2482 [Calothrix sp. PCC 6303]
MKPWITAALLILLICPAPAYAQVNVKIEVDAKDKPLEIKGWLGEENALIGNIRFTASGKDVAALTLLASDLKRQGADEIIGRQQVELIGERKLEAGLPKDFQVKVNGVKLPGTYTGEIELLLPGQKRSEALVIPLKVKAKAKPALVPVKGSEQVQVQLVRCSWDCGLAHLLLPASNFQNQWQLRLDNPIQSPVSLTSAEVVLEGKQTGYQIRTTEVEPPPNSEMPANKIISLPLKWTRSRIPPDRYTGAVYLTLEGKEGRLVIPIDLSMRTGPALPIFVLFVGIILGRLFKYMQEKGIPQSDALAKLYQVEGQIFAESDSKDQEILTPMLKKVRDSVSQIELETVTTDLGKIKERSNCLTSLRKMEQQLQGMEQDPDVGGENGVLAKIQEARNLIKFKNDDKAKELLQQMSLMIAKVSKGMMGADDKPDPSLTAAENEAVLAIASAERAVQATVVQSKTAMNRFAWLKQRLIDIAGVSNELRAEATLWIGRPLLSLALLFGLSLVGIRSLYVEKGTTFGSDPFSDYLGLILWGLSADVASRSVTNLPGGEEKKG